jgi:integrase
MWVAAISTPEGRKVRYAKTRQLAAQKLQELQAQAASMLPEARRDITVEALLTEYLEDKKASWSPRTYQSAEQHIRLHIVPHLGKVKLASLTVHAVSVWLRKLGSTRPAQVARGHLYRACALAMRYDWIPRNPVELTKAPTVTARKPKDLSRDDIRAILTAMQTPIPRGQGYGRPASLDYYPVVATLLGCGLRIGECLALRWEDVDTVAGVLSVRYSLGRADGPAKGAAVMRKPKSRSSVRSVAMPRFLVAALEARRVEQEGHQAAAREAWTNPMGLIFTTPTGAPLRYSSVAERVVHHLKAHGIEGITLHHMRHAYASLLLHEGVPVPVVSKSLGHANPGITMRVYAHALETTTDVVAVVLDELVDGGS